MIKLLLRNKNFDLGKDRWEVEKILRRMGKKILIIHRKKVKRKVQERNTSFFFFFFCHLLVYRDLLCTLKILLSLTLLVVKSCFPWNIQVKETCFEVVLFCSLTNETVKTVCDWAITHDLDPLVSCCNSYYFAVFRLDWTIKWGIHTLSHHM